jgi:hypothetical protein
MIFRSILMCRLNPSQLWTMARAENRVLNYQDIMTGTIFRRKRKLIADSSKKHLAYRVVFVSIHPKVAFDTNFRRQFLRFEVPYANRRSRFHHSPETPRLAQPSPRPGG